MRYSVLNRFRGALIGSYIGENLILSPQLGIQDKIANWTKIGIDKSKILLFEDESTRAIGENYDSNRKNHQSWQNNCNSSKLAIVSLSQLLLCHESLNLLRDEVSKMGQDCAQKQKDILIWGYALSLACREKNLKNQFIEQIIDRLSNRETSSLKTLLLQIQIYINQNTSLQTVVEELSRHKKSSFGAIALALYCFASTPEDFQLCLKRAIIANYQPRITAALTGAIAGAYNSVSGIPLNWRENHDYRPNLKQIYQFSRKLFNYWSGIYQPNTNQSIPSSHALAASNEVQSRIFFKTISQK